MKFLVLLSYFNLISLLNGFNFDYPENNNKKRAIVVGKRMMQKKFPIIYSIEGLYEDTIQLALDKISEETCLNFYKVPILKGEGFKFVKSTNCTLEIEKDNNTQSHTFFVNSNCQHIYRIEKLVSFDLVLQKESNQHKIKKYIQSQLSQKNDNFFSYIRNESSHSFPIFGITYNDKLVKHYNIFEKMEVKMLLNSIDSGIKNKNKESSPMISMLFNDIKLINEHYCSDKCPIKLKCLNDGYTDPNNCDKCKCTKFFVGTLCNKYSKSKDEKCGENILNANKNVKNLRISGNKECFYRIKAKKNYKIKMAILVNSKKKYPLCYGDFGVEIVHTKNKSKTGTIFCQTTKKRFLKSKDNVVLIYYKDFLNIYDVKILFKQVRH